MYNNVLPLSKPPILGYVHHAYPLTAAMAHKDFCHWFCSNYIQLQYCLVDCTLNFFTYVICGNSIYIPIVDYKLLDSEYLYKSGIKVIEFIVNSINMGYYVTMYVDEFFVPERISYKRRHFRHEVMVFGYNLEERILKIVGYTDMGVYSESNITFSAFEESYMSSISKQNDVILFKAKDDLSYQSSFDFDIKNVKDLLQDYLLSRDTSDRLRIFGNPKKKHVYGLNIYKEIIKNFKSVITNNTQWCDRRILHLLWEHKKAMVCRIEYLIDNKYINNRNELLSVYNEIQNAALLLRNKALKFNVRKNTLLIEDMIDSLELMYKREKVAVENLLEMLECEQ